MKRAIVLLLLFITITILLYDQYSRNDETKQITGSATGTSQVSFRILSDCNILLKQGWNLISICSNMTNKTVQDALRDIDGQYRYVLEWNESNQNFIAFSPLAAENPFTELSENKSYFVYLMPSEGEINPSGRLFDDMEIPLVFGWNTPAYPYNFETGIIRYLETINNSYRYVMVWNASGQRFLIYSPLAVENEFYNITAGQGQFIYLNATGAILKYNKSALG